MSRRERTIARLAVLPGAGWLLALFVAPFVLVLAVSVATTDIVGRPVYGWHLEAYRLIFSNDFVVTFGRSIGYAAATTVVCLVLGYLVAYTVARYGGRYRSAIILLALLPWFVDYLIRIYSWIQIVGNGGVLNSVAHALGVDRNIDLLGHTPTVIGGLVYNFLPYMILALYTSIDQLDARVIEAGRDLYSSPVTTLLRVTIPCTLPGILSGCLLVFLPAVGDFATAQLLGSPDQYMIGNIIYTQVQTPGALPVGAGLTVLLVTLLAVLALAGAAVSTPWWRRLGVSVAR